jgi:hypothetical protein
MGQYDPYRLGFRPGPEPVEGPLPPALRLVEEDDLLHLERFPTWVRFAAAGLAAGFALATILTTAATGGQYSLLTGGGWSIEPGTSETGPAATP